jgi:hypothetical protein
MYDASNTQEAIMAKRVGVYIRVSTDGQTTANQRRELEAVAARSGWEVVGIYEDAGIPAPRAARSAPASIGCLRTPRPARWT